MPRFAIGFTIGGMNQPPIQDNTKKQVRNILAVIAAILCLAILKICASFIIPIVVAFFIFVLVNPILSRMDQLKIPRIISTILVMLLVLVVFILFVYVFFLMVNMLIQPDGIPAYASRIQSFDRYGSAFLAPYLDEDPETFSILRFLNIDWYGVLMASLSSISGKFISIFSDALLVYVYLLFIILERQTIFPKLLEAFPRGKAQRAGQLVSRMNRQMSKYLEIKVIISIATGVLFYFASRLSGLDFALVWGVLAVILNFIPTIGSIVGTAGTIMMAIIQFAPDWSYVIYVALLMISIEMVLGNIIDPRLQGVQLNISPLVILISLAIWGYIWGIAGMFLAVPLTSIVQIICANIPSLKPIAIMLSEGADYRRRFERQKKRKKKFSHEIPEEDITTPDAKV